MGPRAFRPELGTSALEARVCLSHSAYRLSGAQVSAFGSAVNRGRFDGLVEVTIHGHRFNAVFGNGHRVTPWLAVGPSKGQR
jgi:hypothetical protein